MSKLLQRGSLTLMFVVLLCFCGMFGVLVVDSGLPVASLSWSDDLRQKKPALPGQVLNEQALRRLSAFVLPLLYSQRSYLDVEYGRTLGKVVIALDSSDILQSDPLGKHVSTIAGLPDYSRIELFVPAATAQMVLRRLAELGLDDRVDVIEVPLTDIALYGSATRWMRDALIESKIGKQRVIMVSPAYRDGSDLTHSDLAFLYRLQARGFHLLPWPVFLSGGNIELGLGLGQGRGRERVLFVGAGELRINAQAYRLAIGRTASPTGVLGLIKQWSGTPRVVLLPNSVNLFHLDSVMVMLGDGVAAVIAPLDPQNVPAEDLAVIEEARRQLSLHGFSVVSIPTTADNIRQFRSPVNGLVYTNKITGQREMLVPAFADAPVDGDSLTTLVSNAYRQAGVTPIFVVDLFSSYRGNLHCAVAVIE